jgi:aryl-alcohol dehydrogenase-like predicted oxidoreductase
MTSGVEEMEGRVESRQSSGAFGGRTRVPGTDLEVAPLCLGGNVFGFTCDEQQSFAVLDAYWAAGGNVIDTADSYCSFLGTDGGESETIIGRWMASRKNRSELVIATKVGQAPGRTDLRPATIHRAVEGSLRRLSVEQIDLYYAHEDHGNPLEETVEAFDQLVTEGKVRSLGASNFSATRLRDALGIANEGDFARFAVLQPEYHLMNRSVYESELRPVCMAEGLGVFPYWSLACGYLTGKYRLAGPVVDSPRSVYVQQFVTEQGEQLLDVLEAIAVRHGMSVAAVALAWLTTRPEVTAPIASVRSPEQLERLVGMVAVEMDASELGAIDGVTLVGQVA